jgi:hypothetical protein
MGTAGKPVSGLFLKDITVESAAAEIKLTNTQGVDMSNVRINGKLVS